jgi:choice-of-anchor B domain-containing protein
MKFKSIVTAYFFSFLFIACSLNSTTEVIFDDDNDGIANSIDNCPQTANPNQEDTNNNDVGDACEVIITNKIPCENGLAGNYPCNGYDMLLHLDLTVFNAKEANDSWGWADPTTNKEYVILGLNNGTAFIDISDTDNPVYLGKLPTRTVSSSWRDLKVYNNHVFIVSEAANHGMQVFDLQKLRDTNNLPKTYTADAELTAFGNAHNIIINEESGYAYVVGHRPSYNGGPIFININNPKQPIIEGGFADGGYSHDAQVVTYTGPDLEHTGKEILIGSNGERNGVNEVVIADVTNKQKPKKLANIGYTKEGYTHQGWFTEDQRYFIVGDELDEYDGNVSNTRILIFDLLDLDNPILLSEYYGPTTAIDHNGYVKGNTFYLANYRAGVRMHDISNIASGTITETGYFDTFPSNDEPLFNGVWNVYPFFESGKIVVSDIEQGLFILKKQ